MSSKGGSKGGSKGSSTIHQIDTTLLFQRLSQVAQKSDMSMKIALQNELCSFPASLFQDIKNIDK